jgi:uncharacterized protein (DUF433 family)
MAAMEKIDWSECPLVEMKPGVQGGAPVLRGTRMPVNAIVDNFDYGVSATEIAELFEIPPERVEAILTYVQSHRVAHPVSAIAAKADAAKSGSYDFIEMPLPPKPRIP